MREFQKKKLLEIISDLHTVHQKIREKLEQKDYETVLSVLMDCQETAIQIGEVVEQTEGNGNSHFFEKGLRKQAVQLCFNEVL